MIKTVKEVKEMLNNKDCINIVQSLFEAIAYRDTIASVIEPEQERIMQELEFYISDEWVEKNKARGRDVKKERITEYKNLYLAPEEDWHRHDEEMQKVYNRVNIHPSKEGNCPLLEADSLVRDVKVQVAETLEPYMGIGYDDLAMSLERYEKYYDLVMKMFASKMKNNFKQAS